MSCGLFELWPTGVFFFFFLRCWPFVSSPGRYLPRHFLCFSAAPFHLCYGPLLSPSVWLTHMDADTQAHIQSFKPSPIPPPGLSRIWPLVRGCLWAIVCSADDHCHQLIPLPIVFWWMRPTLMSTDIGVLDHWGRRNERMEQWWGQSDALFFYYI